LSATGELTADWSLYVTAQFLDARQKSGAPTLVTTNPTTGVVTVVPTVVGRKIENTPERTFSFASEYRLSRILPGLSVNAGAYYLGERAVNAFNQAWIPGYTLFNLGAAYSGKYGGQEFTFRLNAQNVANKRYFSSTGLNLVAQGPPREIRFALSTQF
jgi:iron complex outermembrane receptor protein